MLRLVQLSRHSGGRRVALVDEPHLWLVRDCSSVYELAQFAIQDGTTLRECVERLASDEQVVYDEVYAGRSAWKLLPPIDHPEPTRCFVTGTGLTHKGSAENRQSMHEGAGSRDRGAGSEVSEDLQPPGIQTDSMKMFRLGLEGGRPKTGQIGVAPEWFYKGVGTILRAHGEPLTVPPYALDGGDEAEIAGIYFVGPDGMPYRLGLAQGNEFSDHVMESKNYLYLAPSKLRDCSLGPELVIEPRFDDVSGLASVERDGNIIWQAQQASGECRMCHSLANLEHHQFKYAEHRHPGDVHVHFFGADAFSFKDRLRLEDGDVMSISFEGFGRALRNPIQVHRGGENVACVRTL